jgi:predicted small metal-binding protein
VKEFRCADVLPGCDARLRGETEEELLQVVTVHAHEAHGMDELPVEVVEQVRAAMCDAGSGA